MPMRPPVFVDGTQVGGVDMRLALSGLLTTSGPLVARAGSLGAPVVVRAADSPAMTVVAPTFVYATPGAGFGTGAVQVVNDGPLTLPVPASSATNPRVDIVVVRFAGETVVAGSRGSFCEYLPGVASSAPVAPAIPANGQLLATVAVGVNATSITNAMITNARAQTSAAGGITVSRTSTDVVGVSAGQYRDRADTGDLERFDGTQWRSVGTGATAVSFPTMYNEFTAGGYPILSVYRDGDGRVHISGGCGAAVTFTPANANPYMVCNLNPGHRPSQERFFRGSVMLAAGASQERGSFDFHIYPDGNLMIRGANTSAASGRTIPVLSLLSFEGVNFPT